MAVDPTRETVKKFATEDDGGPVVMLNLLKFADGGRDSYDTYTRSVEKAFRTFLADVGAEVVYKGEGSSALVADDCGEWDMVLLVRYPSRAAFLRMVGDPEYQKLTHLRSGALKQAVLQATRPVPPSR